MLHSFVTPISFLGRSWLKVAFLAVMSLVAAGQSANAQVLFFDNYPISELSTHNDYVLARGTPALAPSSTYMTVYYTAGSTSGAPYYQVHLYLYDVTEGVYVNSVSQQAPIREREFSAAFPVQPGHYYSVWMYVSNVQAGSHWYFYNDLWEIADGYFPFG